MTALGAAEAADMYMPQNPTVEADDTADSAGEVAEGKVEQVGQTRAAVKSTTAPGPRFNSGDNLAITETIYAREHLAEKGTLWEAPKAGDVVKPDTWVAMFDDLIRKCADLPARQLQDAGFNVSENWQSELQNLIKTWSDPNYPERYKEADIRRLKAENGLDLSTKTYRDISLLRDAYKEKKDICLKTNKPGEKPQYQVFGLKEIGLALRILQALPGKKEIYLVPPEFLTDLV